MMSSPNDPSAPLTAVPSDPVSLQLTLYRHGHGLAEYVANLVPPSLAAVLDPVDVVQDVYLEAMRRSTEFRPSDDDHARRWLKTIARHRIVDLLRYHEAAKRGGTANDPFLSSARSSNDTTVGLLAEVAVYHRTPSQSAAAHEIAELVNRSIADLPPDYAEVLRLRYLDGLSGKVVAAQLLRTENSVHLLCQRAVDALRVRLRSTMSLG